MASVADDFLRDFESSDEEEDNAEYYAREEEEEHVDLSLPSDPNLKKKDTSSDFVPSALSLLGLEDNDYFLFFDICTQIYRPSKVYPKTFPYSNAKNSTNPPLTPTFQTKTKMTMSKKTTT